MERQSFYVSCPDCSAPWRQSSDIRMNITPIETELTGSIESSVTSVKKPLMTARTIAAAISAPIGMQIARIPRRSSSFAPPNEDGLARAEDHPNRHRGVECPLAEASGVADDPLDRDAAELQDLASGGHAEQARDAEAEADDAADHDDLAENFPDFRQHLNGVQCFRFHFSLPFNHAP